MVFDRQQQRDQRKEDHDGADEEDVAVGDILGLAAGQIGKGLAAGLDDGLADQRAAHHRDQHEEDRPDALELPLGVFGIELLGPDLGDLQDPDIADAHDEDAQPDPPVEQLRGVDLLGLHRIDDQQADDVADDRGDGNIGVLVPVDEHPDGDGAEHGDHQRDGLDDAHLIGRVAEIVDQIVADVGKVGVEADGKDRDGQVNEHQLLEGKKALEIKDAPELVPEGALPVGRRVVAFVEGEHGDDAEDDHEQAHRDKQTHVVVVFADQDAADDRADQGAEHGLGRQRRPDAAAVFVIEQIRGPGAEARRAAHGAEEAHHAVGQHDADGDEGVDLLADELRQTEGDGEHAPEDVAPGDELPALAGAVGPGAEEEGREGRGQRGPDQHPRDDGGILPDLCVNEGVEPLVFHVPADLPGKAKTPDQEPHAETGPFFRHKLAPFVKNYLFLL